MLSQNHFDLALLHAVDLALVKARELEYEPEDLQFEVRTTGDTCRVYFSPPEDSPSLGGDLSIYVDLKKMRIISVERGQ